MIAGIVEAIRPVLEPLLKLELKPPALPEGSMQVRAVRPSEDFLTYNYLKTLGAGLGHVMFLVTLGIGGAAALGRWAVPLIVLAIVFSALSYGLTLVAVRVDWELRHYLIGDRSLRVRHGAFRQAEVTLSFANIQNVEVFQGPLERVLGFKNVRVTTAGGIVTAEDARGGITNGAVLAGLENAEEVRAVILEALKRFRDAGLGDTGHAEFRQPSRTGLTPAALHALAEVRDAAIGLKEAAEAALLFRQR